MSLSRKQLAGSLRLRSMPAFTAIRRHYMVDDRGCFTEWTFTADFVVIPWRFSVPLASKLLMSLAILARPDGTIAGPAPAIKATPAEDGTSGPPAPGKKIEPIQLTARSGPRLRCPFGRDRER
jgi:hypothetical protein